MRRLCPSCIHRTDHLVNEDCPVCDGTGHLTLGAAALHYYDPGAVSQAVVLALEATARVTDQSLTLSDDRTTPIRATITKLRAAGIIAPAPLATTTAQQPLPPAGKTPAGLAGWGTQESITGIDEALATAARHEYQDGDRPNARGLPVLSASGHPSHLARVTDPQPNGRSTRKWLQEQHRHKREARVLVAAADELTKPRKRRTKR